LIAASASSPRTVTMMSCKVGMCYPFCYRIAQVAGLSLM
jgi:hypothetical protein